MGDGYRVPLTPVLPHQDGAGPELRFGGRLGDLAAGEPVKKSERGLVVSAVELLLDAPGDHAAQQIFGPGRGRGLAVAPYARPPPGASIKSSEPNALHTYWDMVNLNGQCL